MRIKSLLMMAWAALTGCSTVPVSVYENERPVLKLEEYFNGTLDAWGMFQGRDGEAVKRFKVVIYASWNGAQGILDERFEYSDGSRQQRVWRIEKTSEHTYVGQADDVVGEAIGTVSGNALFWTYTLRLPVDDKTYDVTFDDWMYLQDDGVMINRSVMKKFGIRLGEVTIFFKRRS